ncbi:hypothetical protein Fot_56293 [Forsythia ovata]|uniref:Uncharacterized protein n=1 Tax=Forsythia ovata TaxID=205694 RepID=A0ABD1P2U8_9LAMI
MSVKKCVRGIQSWPTKFNAKWMEMKKTATEQALRLVCSMNIQTDVDSQLHKRALEWEDLELTLMNKLEKSKKQLLKKEESLQWRWHQQQGEGCHSRAEPGTLA